MCVFFFLSELCWWKAVVAYIKPQQRKKEERERLRGVCVCVCVCVFVEAPSINLNFPEVKWWRHLHFHLLCIWKSFWTRSIKHRRWYREQGHKKVGPHAQLERDQTLPHYKAISFPTLSCKMLSSNRWLSRVFSYRTEGTVINHRKQPCSS